MAVERREDTPAARELPPAAKAAYRSFHRHLKAAALAERLDIPRPVWNGIRHAWRDGYWAGREGAG